MTPTKLTRTRRIEAWTALGSGGVRGEHPSLPQDGADHPPANRVGSGRPARAGGVRGLALREPL